MTCGTARTRTPRLPAMVGAVVMCASLAFFVAAPSAWGSPTVDPGGIAIATSSGDALIAPHALAPSAPRITAIARVVVAIVLLAAIVITIDGCTRRRESLSARHARTRALHWMHRRGPPPQLLAH